MYVSLYSHVYAINSNPLQDIKSLLRDKHDQDGYNNNKKI